MGLQIPTTSPHHSAKNKIDISRGMGISKAITNAPLDTPYLSEIPGYKVAVDIVNQAATLVLNFLDKKNSTNTNQRKPNGKK